MFRPSAVVTIVSIAVLGLSLHSGCKDDESTASDESAEEEGGTEAADPKADAQGSPAKAPPVFDMRALQVALAPPWTSRYEEFLQSWVWSKVGDASKPPLARFYVGRMPPSPPRTVDHYASKLMHEPSFQDSGFVYTKIDRKEILDDGWVIVGEEKSTLDPKAKPSVGFVVYRNLGGREIRCRGGSFSDPKDLDLVLAACKAAQF